MGALLRGDAAMQAAGSVQALRARCARPRCFPGGPCRPCPHSQASYLAPVTSVQNPVRQICSTSLTARHTSDLGPRGMS